MRRHTERWGWGLLILATYAGTTLAYFILPLGARWGESLLGTAIFAPDPVFAVGILEWGYKSLWSPSLHFFDWNIGFPLHNTLANTEHLLGWQILYSPLRWAGASPVAAYDIVLLTSIVLSGLSMACLARHFGTNRYGAWIAGFIFAFVPFHLTHAIHLQTMAVCWSPFALLFLDRFLARGTATEAAAVATTFILTLLSAIYFGVFLLLVLLVYTLLAHAVGRHRLQWPMIRTLAVTSVLTVLVLLPVTIPYLRFAGSHGLPHPAATQVDLSVALVNFLRAPQWLAVWSGTWLARDSGLPFTAAFPGLTASVLVGIYLFLHPKDQESGRRDVILGSLGLFALLLSLGPFLKLRDCCAVRIAGAYIPMPGSVFLALPMVRAPVRILMYTYLVGAVLCGLSVSAMTNRLSQRARPWLALLILLLLVAEDTPMSWFASRSLALPEPLAVSDAYPFLAEEPNRGSVVELPAEDVTGYRTPVMALYTYGSTGHLRRIVGYLGSIRLSAPDALQQAAQELPDPRALNLLRTAGVTRLIVHRRLMKTEEAVRLIAALEHAHYRTLHDGAEAVVFALDQRAVAR